MCLNKFHTDPSHQRAGGNLRYFERLLAKELREMDRSKQEPVEEKPIQLGTYERPRDYLPEREIYEALCRGEGVKMVSPVAKIICRLKYGRTVLDFQTNL